ncbi:TolC family protein [Endothiovibrio diazotrophicus]
MSTALSAHRRRSAAHVRLRALASLTLALCASAGASTPAYEALRARLAQHPDVRADEAQARQWARQAEGALGLPNPSVTLGLNNLPVNEPTRFDRYLPSSRSLEVSQKIPNAAGREAERDTLLTRRGLAELERRERLAALERRLIEALAERERIGASRAALARQVTLIGELEQWLRGEMAGGEAVYGRFDELEIQRARIGERRVALEGEARRWEATLRELVEAVPEMPPPAVEPRSWDGSPEGAFAPLIAERERTLARNGVARRVADLSPDYAVGFAWQQRESGRGFDGEDWFTVKLTVSVPLWAENNQRPKLAAAEVALERATAHWEQRLRETRREYDTARADYETAAALLTELKHRAARLEDLEAANRRRYEAGDGSLEAVIRPAMQHAELELERATQRARRTVAAARINALLVEEMP